MARDRAALASAAFLTALAIGPGAWATPCPPPEEPACVAAFIVPGSPLAEAVAGVSTPPACSCDADAVTFGAAGARFSATASYQETVATVISVGIKRSAMPVPLSVADGAASLAASGATVTRLSGGGTVTIAGHKIETMPVSLGGSGIFLVCVVAADETTGRTIAQICRASPEADQAAMLAKAAAIVSLDLPSVAW